MHESVHACVRARTYAVCAPPLPPTAPNHTHVHTHKGTQTTHHTHDKLAHVKTQKTQSRTYKGTHVRYLHASLELARTFTIEELREEFEKERLLDGMSVRVM